MINIIKIKSLIFLGLSLFNFSNQPITSFEIHAVHSDEMMTLTCNYGCAWNELSFTLTEDMDPVYVNEYGMATQDDEYGPKEGLADFYFSFRKQDGIIACFSKKGTNWDQLTYSCNVIKCRGTISEKGVVTD